VEFVINTLFFQKQPSTWVSIDLVCCVDPLAKRAENTAKTLFMVFVNVATECFSEFLTPDRFIAFVESVPHKASSASCFCGLSSVSKRLY